jgi:hypothetical protein
MKFVKVSGNNSCVEKKCKLDTNKYEEYKGVNVGKGDYTLVVDVWLHRVDEGISGLTFEEWDPSADTDSSEVPVAMIETDSRYGYQEETKNHFLKKIIKNKKSWSGLPYQPQDQVISLFAGILGGPDREHGPDIPMSWENTNARSVQRTAWGTGMNPTGRYTHMFEERGEKEIHPNNNRDPYKEEKKCSSVSVFSPLKGSIFSVSSRMTT